MVLWWIGNVIGLVVVIPLVTFLANRVIRQALEASRYADDIREHAGLLAANLEPVSGLADTPDHVREAALAARRYLATLAPES